MESNWLQKAEQIMLKTLQKPFKKFEVSRHPLGKTMFILPDNERTAEAVKTYASICHTKEQCKLSDVPCKAVFPKAVFYEMIKHTPFCLFKNLNSKGEMRVDFRNYFKEESKAMKLPFIIMLALFTIFSWVAPFTLATGIVTIILYVFAAIWTVVSIIIIFVGDSIIFTESNFSISVKEFSDKKDIPITLLSLPMILAGLINQYVVKKFITNSTKKSWLFPNKVNGGRGTYKMNFIFPPNAKKVLETLELAQIHVLIYEEDFKIGDENIRQNRLIYPIIISETKDQITVHTAFDSMTLEDEQSLNETLKTTMPQITTDFFDKEY